MLYKQEELLKHTTATHSESCKICPYVSYGRYGECRCSKDIYRGCLGCRSENIPLNERIYILKGDMDNVRLDVCEGTRSGGTDTCG